MGGQKKRSVGSRGLENEASIGIKELKDKASEIIATVERTGRSISITRRNQEVARIIPIPRDPHERLVAAGLVNPGPKPPPLGKLKLERLARDASPAVQAILSDREDD